MTLCKCGADSSPTEHIHSWVSQPLHCSISWICPTQYWDSLVCRSPNHPSSLCFCATGVLIIYLYAFSKSLLKIPLWPALLWLDPSLARVVAFFFFPVQTGLAACPSLRDVFLLPTVVFNLLCNYTGILLLEQLSNRSYTYIYPNLPCEVFKQFTLSEFTLLVVPFALARCSISLYFSLFNYLVPGWIFWVAVSLRNLWLYLHDRQQVALLQLPLEPVQFFRLNQVFSVSLFQPAGMFK